LIAGSGLMKISSRWMKQLFVASGFWCVAGSFRGVNQAAHRRLTLAARDRVSIRIERADLRPVVETYSIQAAVEVFFQAV